MKINKTKLINLILKMKEVQGKLIQEFLKGE